MKKLLNTLYVTSEDVYLKQEGEAIAVMREKSIVARFPIHGLEGLVLFGGAMISPYLMGKCAELGVTITFLNQYGRFLARVNGPISGNVRLRLAQMRAYEDKSKKGELARGFLIGKLMNTRAVLLRRIRDHGETSELKAAVEAILDVLRRVKASEPDAERLRGLEGEAAAIYFGVFNELLVPDNPFFAIQSRNRRPPLDPMNALLSYVYTLLAHICRGACESVGLDSQIGFLHEIRPGRVSLALDLMEEFRAVFGDRFALSLINLKQLDERSFIKTESGAIVLEAEARKELLTAWRKKKQEIVKHPFLEEKMPVGLFPYAQALLLARHLRGDLDAYPAYMVK